MRLPFRCRDGLDKCRAKPLALSDPCLYAARLASYELYIPINALYIHSD